jgi:protoporphyrinogen oxidase
MEIGIIGAGMTGLTAAYFLSEHGHQVTIYEHAPFIGGHASTFTLNGVQLERGYHHIFTSDEDILDLIQIIGIPDGMRWIKSTVGIYAESKIYALNTPFDLLKLRPLKILNRVRLGLVLFYIQRQKNWMKYEKISAAEWLNKYLGSQAYKVLWEPLLIGKFGENLYKNVPMAWIWGKLNTRVKSRDKGANSELLGYPVGSFNNILTVLNDKLINNGVKIHINTSVTSIYNDENGTNISTNSAESKPKRFDKILSTVSNDIFEKLTPELHKFPNYISKLRAVNYLSAVVLILELENSLSEFYWMNIAEPTFPFLGIIEHTNLIPNSEYQGSHIIYITNYVDTETDIYQMTERDLIETYKPYLNKINPSFNDSWIKNSFHFKINKAQPVMNLDYSKKMPPHNTPIKNVYLANTSQIYPEDRGTNYSVRMGKYMASTIMEDGSNK